MANQNEPRSNFTKHRLTNLIDCTSNANFNNRQKTTLTTLGTKFRNYLRIAFFGGLGAMTVVITMHLLIVALFFLNPLPSDRALMTQFPSKKPDLQKLLTMSDEDMDFYRITNTIRTLSGVGYIPDQRWQSYRDLFNTVGLQYGLERNESDDVFFLVSVNLAGDSKGYAHLTKRPIHLVSQLDDASIFGFWHDNPQLAGGPVFRELGNNWYLWRNVHY